MVQTFHMSTSANLMIHIGGKLSRLLSASGGACVRYKKLKHTSFEDEDVLESIKKADCNCYGNSRPRGLLEFIVDE